MPALSKTQQRLMGQAYGVRKFIDTNGKDGIDPDSIKSAYRQTIVELASNMKKKALKDFASTKHKGLPIYSMEQEDTDEDHDVNVTNIEESILNIIEIHLPPHTTKGELLKTIRRK